jgi:nucleoside-diphosphate-sugar epimerase
MANPVRPTADFWRGKRVLLTGHTGLKGSWLALWLARLGAEVTGLALPPATEPNLYTLARVGDGLHADQRCDVRDVQAVAARVQAAHPQIVLHLAAQALVRAGYADPVGTYATNVMGTAHVLDALREQADVRAVVVVTTDKVYRNREWVYPYREDDPLGGHDPYSASKAAVEIVTASYRDAFLAAQGVAVATALKKWCAERGVSERTILHAAREARVMVTFDRQGGPKINHRVVSRSYDNKTLTKGMACDMKITCKAYTFNVSRLNTLLRSEENGFQLIQAEQPPEHGVAEETGT